MPPSFRLEEHGLKKLRVDQFAGLVFGTLSHEAPPLAELHRQPDRVRALAGCLRGKPKILGTTSQILHNNWKLYFENVKDTYHATLLHTFFTTFRISRLTSAGGVDDRRERRPSRQLHARQGRHGRSSERSDQLYAGIQSLREDFRLADPRLSRHGRGVRRRHRRCRSSASSRISYCSRSRTRSRCGWYCRKGPDKTELQWTYIGFEDDDAAMTERRLRRPISSVRPAMCRWRMARSAILSSARSPARRTRCSVLEMGGFEHVSEANRTTEASVRGFWHAYRPLMGF